MTTKAEFLREYRKALRDEHPWAADNGKLDRFMESARATVCDGADAWNHDGNCVVVAWKRIGMEGKPSLKKLRALL